MGALDPADRRLRCRHHPKYARGACPDCDHRALMEAIVDLAPMLELVGFTELPLCRPGTC